jgi:hypothetical protein
MFARLQTLAHARPLAILTLFYVLFPAVILPAAEAQLKAYSGGFGPIDLLFGYTPAQVFEMVAAYGEEGRAFYRTLELTLDVIYPIAYTMFFSALLTAVLPRAFPHRPAAHHLALLPLPAFLIDMAENIGIVTMLSQYPTQSETVAQISSLLTTAKWLWFGAIILTLLIGLTAWGFRRFTRPSHSHS